MEEKGESFTHHVASQQQLLAPLIPMPSRSSAAAPKRIHSLRHLNFLLLHRRSTPRRRAVRIAGERVDISCGGVDREEGAGKLRGD
jgi:hypothetical protein